MKLSFNAGAVCENILYFSDNTCNALMKLNLLDGQLAYISNFPCEEDQLFIHKQCIKIKDKLYFVPNAGHNIHIYDLNSGDISNVRICRNCPTRLLFNGGILIDDELWIIPCDISQEVICLNISSMEVKSLFKFENDLKNHVSDSKQAFWKFCLHEKNIYMALIRTNIIVKFDIEKCKIEMVETEVDNIDSIYRTNNSFWICTIDGKVYLWEEEENKCEKAILEGNRNDGGAYVIAESLTGDIYLIPHYGCQIMKKSKECVVFKGNNEFYISNKELKIKRVNFESFDIYKNKIILFPGFGSDIIIIDKCGINVVKAVLNEKDNIYMEKKSKGIRNEMKSNVLFEGRNVGLEEYIYSF